VTEGIVELRPPADEQRRRLSARSVLAAYDPRPLRGGYGALPVLLVAVLTFAGGIETSASAVLGPEMKHDLHLNFTQWTQLLALVTLAITLAAGPVGYLVDRVSRIPLVVIGGLLNAAGLAGVGFGYSAAAVGVGRLLSSSGSTLNLAPQLSLLADWYPVDLRGRMLAIRQLGT
jgi:MFS family permease